MKHTIDELLHGVNGLVTLPVVFMRINQLLENPNSSTEDIARAINLDPAFTVRLLGVANSTFYGFAATVDTAEKAVSIIGTRQIANLALSTAIASSFSKLPNKLVSMAHFWQHSLYCALAARKLARLCGIKEADALFTAGLLHDIGELVIFNRLPQEATEALLLVQGSADELAMYQAEQLTLGFDHAQVGAALARHWKLPPVLQDCISFHHEIHAAKQHPREVALVHIANILAQMAEIKTLDLADVGAVDPAAWELAGLAASDVVTQVVTEIQSEFVETEKLFFAKDTVS